MSGTVMNWILLLIGIMVMLLSVDVVDYLADKLSQYFNKRTK